MSKFINIVGGILDATEIVKYHSLYFKRYPYYDTLKKCFSKQKDEARVKDFVYMNFLIGEIRKVEGVKK